MTDMLAFLFPGQGAQFAGMGKDLFDAYPESREVFNEADEVLGFEVSRLCFKGPNRLLKETRNAQPAILTHSVAVAKILENNGIKPKYVAGHSLGEYTALVVAGAFCFGDALRVVKRRAELMHEAVFQHPGTMAAIIGLSASHVKNLCEAASRFGVVQAANFNSPDQVVISGQVAAVNEATKIALRFGAAKTTMLKVSGAFHSNLMNDVVEGLRVALDKVEVRAPQVAVVANRTANVMTTPDEVRTALIEQVNSPVLWCDSMRHIIDMGASKFAELGPGKVLKGLMRKIDIDKEAECIGGARDVKRFLGMVK
jgi:[acyl-carrier-protein] S-malonyltransferase